MRNLKLILSGIVVVGLLSGCMSEEEKRAKEILVQQTIKEDNIRKAYKVVTGKEIPKNELTMINGDREKLEWIRNNYEFVINNDTKVWLKKMEKAVGYKDIKKIDYSNAFGPENDK